MIITENPKIQRRIKMKRKVICNLPLLREHPYFTVCSSSLSSIFPPFLPPAHTQIYLSFYLTPYTLLTICFLFTTLWFCFSHLHFRLPIPLLWGTAWYIIHGNAQSHWRRLEWLHQCGLLHWRWKQKSNSTLTLDCGSVSCLGRRAPNRNEPFASGTAVYEMTYKITYHLFSLTIYGWAGTIPKFSSWCCLPPCLGADGKYLLWMTFFFFFSLIFIA